MIKEFEVIKLKNQFKKMFVKYKTRQGDMPCGAELAEHMVPALGVMKQELEVIYNRLREIDSNCPQVVWLEEAQDG